MPKVKWNDNLILIVPKTSKFIYYMIIHNSAENI